MSIELKTDDNGNVVVFPMTRFEVRTAGDLNLLVIIEYVETPEQFQTGERKHLQTIVLPQQALEFAETLKTAATMILPSKSGNRVQ